MSNIRRFDPPFFVKILLLFSLIAIGSFKNKFTYPTTAKKDADLPYSRYEYKTNHTVTTLDTESASFRYNKD